MADRSTTREVSRFRPDFAATRPAHPVQVGTCRYCLRPVWHGSRPGLRLLAPAPRHPGSCDTCGTWLDEHPGQDPRDARHTAAERIPAEQGEQSPRWRHDDDRRCAGAPAILFEPDPDDEDEPLDLAARRRNAADRRDAAVVFCASCPLREVCTEKALTHGYEGLWGGVFFERYRWESLLTGERGFTIHATPRMRRREDERVSA